MAKINANKVRIDIASKLVQMGTILNDSGILLDDGKSAFESAADQCRNNYFVIDGHKPNANSWGYSLNRILVRASRDKMRHVNPDGASDITIEYSVSVVGNAQNFEKLCDPLESLSFNIVINAKNSKNQDTKYRCCWHLDRNIEGDESPQDAHPHYHFHFGGNNMNFNDGTRNYGSTLFLDSPRIAHMPLDAILATDFVLSNFVSNQWKDLTHKKTGNPQYQNIIKFAQQQIWKPYAIAASKNFAPFNVSESTWSTEEVWPQLIL